MKKVKKLKLAELSVKSFITKNSLLQETIRGGESVLGGNCSNDRVMLTFFTCRCAYNTID